MLIVLYIFSVIISFGLNFGSMNFYKKIIEFNNSKKFTPEHIYKYFIKPDEFYDKILVIFILIIFGITPFYNIFYSLFEFIICYRFYKENEKECANRIINKLLDEESKHLQFQLSSKFIKNFNNKVDWSKLK